MADIFGANFTATNLHAPKSTVPWKLGDFLTGEDYPNLLFNNFAINEEEQLEIVKSFSDLSYVFTFGRNAYRSLATASFIYLFTEGVCSNSPGSISLDAIKSKYEEYRVSKKKESIDLQLEAFTGKGYLVSMAVSQVNSEKRFAVITFSFILDQES